MRLIVVPLANNLLPHRLTHYPREWVKTCRAKMALVGMIPLGEAPVATLVAVEEIFLPVVEMLQAVEARVIPTPHQMAILTPPSPTRRNSLEDASPTGMMRGRKSMIGGVMSLLSIFGNNARVRSQCIDRRNQRN